MTDLTSDHSRAWNNSDLIAVEHASTPVPQHQSDEPKLIVVAVCTRGRPKMLSKCLKSLVQQSASPNWRWQLVVVENDLQPNVKNLVHGFLGTSPVPIQYHRQDKLGIPFARNLAVEVALDLGADWIAFLDDDETAAPDWLEQMIQAVEGYGADVVEGSVYFDASQGTGFWINEAKYLLEEGLARDRASTANVAFSSRLVAEHPIGLGLRFNERLRFTGGSDTEFFLRASDAGARIVWSDRPRVIEHLPALRLTYRWQLGRAYRIAANEAQLFSEAHGVLPGIRKYGRRSVVQLWNGALGLAVSPFRMRHGKERFREKALKSGCRLAWGLGSLIGLTPLRPQPYARVDGE